MKICLVQFNPAYPNPGMLDSYNEVVESYAWGFAALGYDCERRINHFNPEALNILFGYSVPLGLGLINTFPANTIIFNLERWDGLVLAGSIVEYLANKYQFWDYSKSNVAALNALNPKFPAYYAKTAYAPVLEKLPTGIQQDIDVLFYGRSHPLKSEVLDEIGSIRPDLTSLSVMTLSSFWGAQRDEFIARSKVLVNVSYSPIFEIVRVSYLLANKKAVVCTYTDNLSLDDLDIEGNFLNGGLRFVRKQDAKSVCQALADDDTARLRYAEMGYELFREHDIRDVIKDFFG